MTHFQNPTAGERRLVAAVQDAQVEARRTRRALVFATVSAACAVLVTVLWLVVRDGRLDAGDVLVFGLAACSIGCVTAGVVDHLLRKPNERTK